MVYKHYFLRDCSYAYYVHCFAHQLQLVLVAASKKVDPIWKFFSSLSSVVNVLCASPKRHTKFHAAQVAHIEDLIIAGERGPGRGLNMMQLVPLLNLLLMIKLQGLIPIIISQEIPCIIAYKGFD